MNGSKLTVAGYSSGPNPINKACLDLWWVGGWDEIPDMFVKQLRPCMM